MRRLAVFWGKPEADLGGAERGPRVGRLRCGPKRRRERRSLTGIGSVTRMNLVVAVGLLLSRYLACMLGSIWRQAAGTSVASTAEGHLAERVRLQGER
jgi:hypothetical protein